MNLQPVSHMYANWFSAACVQCNHKQGSHELVADLDGSPGTYYCLFCADAHDPTARPRQSKGSVEQWQALSARQRQTASKHLGI